jgi:fumarate hydratase subunit beta
MAKPIELVTPLSTDMISVLRAGDSVVVSGQLYTARDAAHRRLLDLIASGKEIPIPIEGQVIYYVGPSPAPPGRVIGAAGPTTSYRMDPYTPKLLELGLKGMIGKGKRSKEVIDAMVKYKAVYLAAIGGAIRRPWSRGHPETDRSQASGRGGQRYPRKRSLRRRTKGVPADLVAR